jgi:CRISPR system Cascade subunit CasD
MARFLVVRLDGPMQAWGTHTFEDQRSSNLFPTRSGLLGLLAACLGIDRGDGAASQRLAESVVFTVRIDDVALSPDGDEPVARSAVRIDDYHTVLGARKVDGSVNPNPVVSRREYLYDAAFTIAVGERPGGPIRLEAVADALQRPIYTPVLGRRSCPIARPLTDGRITEASDPKSLFSSVPPHGGPIYAEGDWISEQPIELRDVPMPGRTRRFATRRVYLHKG